MHSTANSPHMHCVVYVSTATHTRVYIATECVCCEHINCTHSSHLVLQQVNYPFGHQVITVTFAPKYGREDTLDRLAVVVVMSITKKAYSPSCTYSGCTISCAYCVLHAIHHVIITSLLRGGVSHNLIMYIA